MSNAKPLPVRKSQNHHREEKEAIENLGEAYHRYAEKVPRFFPNWGRAEGICEPPDTEGLSS